jgi:NADH-quinone oxidoreductase subunit L
MTSFYSWRLMFLTFFGSPRGDHHAHDHAHESPRTMLIPLGALALGAVFAGMIWYNSFFGDTAQVRSWFGMPPEAASAEGHGAAADAHGGGTEAAADTPGAATTDTAADTHGAGAATEPAADTHVAEGDAAGGATPLAVATPVQGALVFGPDNHVLHDAHAVPKWVKVSPFVAMLIGLGLAWQMYIRRPDWPAKLAANQRPLYLFLLNKWYFDEIFEALLVRPAKWLGGFLWRRGDGGVIDGSINGMAMGVVPWFTRLAARAQNGYIFSYAFAMVMGIAVLVTWMTLAGGN